MEMSVDFGVELTFKSIHTSYPFTIPLFSNSRIFDNKENDLARMVWPCLNDYFFFDAME